MLSKTTTMPKSMILPWHRYRQRSTHGDSSSSSGGGVHIHSSDFARTSFRQQHIRSYVSVRDVLLGVDPSDADIEKFNKEFPIPTLVKGRYLSPWSNKTEKRFFQVLDYLWNRKQNKLTLPNLEKISLHELMDPQETSMRRIKEQYEENDAIHANALATTSQGSNASGASTAAGEGESPKLNVTWIGHATCYFEVDGVRFITDPMFSERASPLPFAGPRRFFPSSVQCDNVSELEIDVVLLSHTHYDHYDAKSIVAIGNRALWMVPMGVKELLEGHGITNCVELNWWETYKIKTKRRSASSSSPQSPPPSSLLSSSPSSSSSPSPSSSSSPSPSSSLSSLSSSSSSSSSSSYENETEDDIQSDQQTESQSQIQPYQTEEGCIEIAFTPAKHWTSRHFFDRNLCLWGSFAVLSPSQRVFFTGDTAYCDVFQAIGKRFGPFDLALVPIGAYEPRYFMKHHHCNPEEALQIHTDLQAKQSLAIHWGTFPLADEDIVEPALELGRCREASGMFPEEFFTVRPGETFTVGDPLVAISDFSVAHDDLQTHYNAHVEAKLERKIKQDIRLGKVKAAFNVRQRVKDRLAALRLAKEQRQKAAATSSQKQV